MKLSYLIDYELVWQIKSYSQPSKQPFQSWTEAQYTGGAVVFASPDSNASSLAHFTRMNKTNLAQRMWQIERTLVYVTFYAVSVVVAKTVICWVNAL